MFLNYNKLFIHAPSTGYQGTGSLMQTFGTLTKWYRFKYIYKSKIIVMFEGIYVTIAQSCDLSKLTDFQTCKLSFSTGY